MSAWKVLFLQTITFPEKGFPCADCFLGAFFHAEMVTIFPFLTVFAISDDYDSNK